MAGEGDEGADVAHDEMEAGVQEGCRAAGAIEVGYDVGEVVGGAVGGGRPHCLGDVGTLLQGLVEDDDW